MHRTLIVPGNLLLLLCSFIGSAANAAEGEALWEGALAAYSRYGPAYPASEDYQTNIIPLPLPIYRGTFLRVGDEGDKPIKTRIFRRDWVKLDIDFGLIFGSDSEEIDARTGMPDLDLLLEAGPELEFKFVDRIPGETYLSLATRAALSLDGLSTSWRGIVFSTELRYELPFNTNRTKLDLRLTPEFASNDFMDYYYSVPEAFATATRPAYQAEGGYLGTMLTAAMQHELNRKFEFRAGVRFGFYNGAANDDSPLFTAETTSEVYFAFLWKFWESKRRAEVHN